MALATAAAFRDEFSPVILAPGGDLIAEARKMDVEIEEIDTQDPVRLVSSLLRYLSKYGTLAVIATRPIHAQVFLALNLPFRRRAALLFVVHTRAATYHRRLNSLPVTIVAISRFVKEQLIALGVRDEKIVVIEDFLMSTRVTNAPRRAAFAASGIHRVGLISRLEPSKRLDVLLTCLETHPQLRSIEFKIYGVGEELVLLEKRVRENRLNVTFEGFRSDVDKQFMFMDLLLHVCPDEPFGLVVLEAMAAGVPVLTADAGGSADLVNDGVTGFHFRANDPASLGAALTMLSQLETATLNRVVAEALRSLQYRFAERERIADYRALILQHLQPG